MCTATIVSALLGLVVDVVDVDVAGFYYVVDGVVVVDVPIWESSIWLMC